MNFKPSFKKTSDKLPPPPKDSNSPVVVGLQLLFIFTLLRIVMLIFGVRIIHIPLYDAALYWILDTVKFQLWAWGLIDMV